MNCKLQNGCKNTTTQIKSLITKFYLYIGYHKYTQLVSKII